MFQVSYLHIQGPILMGILNYLPQRCLLFPVAVFLRKIGRRTNGLNFPSILEEARVRDKYFGIFVNYSCIS